MVTNLNMADCKSTMKKTSFIPLTAGKTGGCWYAELKDGEKTFFKSFGASSPTVGALLSFIKVCGFSHSNVRLEIVRGN